MQTVARALRLFTGALGAELSFEMISKMKRGEPQYAIFAIAVAIVASIAAIVKAFVLGARPPP